jgi:hypothetical protein
VSLSGTPGPTQRARPANAAVPSTWDRVCRPGAYTARGALAASDSAASPPAPMLASISAKVSRHVHRGHASKWTARARPGRLSARSALHSKSVLYGASVWARRVLNVPKNGGLRPEQLALQLRGGRAVAVAKGAWPRAEPTAISAAAPHQHRWRPLPPSGARPCAAARARHSSAGVRRPALLLAGSISVNTTSP